jgi:Uma2 family endonuclease
MSAVTQDFIEVIGRLPAGGEIIFADVDWEEYEQLLADFHEDNTVRISYSDGRLEAMSPLPEHEEYKDVIHDLLRTLARELGQRMETRGSATLKRELRAKGVEPDGSYWLRSAGRLIGKRRIDLNSDPPPDLVVEIDLSSDSSRKFSIYAALGVAELWRYDGSRMHFYRLDGQSYTEIHDSVAFPLLSNSDMTRFIEQAKSAGQDSAIESLIEWLKRPEQVSTLR